jgi:uncharacterized protein
LQSLPSSLQAASYELYRRARRFVKLVRSVDRAVCMVATSRSDVRSARVHSTSPTACEAGASAATVFILPTKETQMPHRATAPTGAPCWLELSTSDVARARSFYGELFGWTSEEPNDEFGGYFNFSKDADQVAGGIAVQPGGVPNVWTVYLATEDAAATADAISASGGTVMMPPMQVMDLGTMAIAADPGGAVVGLWQPGTHKGFTMLGEPGTPSWFELHTRAYEASIAFYRDAFKWDVFVMADTPEFRYTTQGENDSATAGIMDASMFPDVPVQWSVYFESADVDASLVQAVALGGTVWEPAQDTPYGRMARVTDPMGTSFRLRGPNTEG